MLGLLSALIEPVAKVLLKAWLGDAGAEIGGGLLKYARDVLADGKKAADAARHARQIAGEVVNDLADAMEHRDLERAAIETAAAELAETISAQVSTAFLIGHGLQPGAVSTALLRFRPIEQVFDPSEPEYEAYRLLTELLAERLCKVAPDLPDYTQARDSKVLTRLEALARDVPAVLSGVTALKQTVTAVGEQVTELAGREERRRSGYAADYCRVVRDKLDYVEILGLPELGPESREARLSIAFLSLTASIGGIGRLGFEDLLDVLPLFGGRLLIEGVAGSGKSTLLRWTAVQAASETVPARSILAGSLFWPFVRGDSGRDAMPRIHTLVKQAFAGADVPPAVLKRRPLGLDIGSLLAKPSIALPFISEIITQGEFNTKFAGAWRNAVPFQVRLRHVEGALPSPEDLPRHLSSALGQPPEGWVREQLTSGNALLLIDGVDEVPQGERRQAAHQGIRDYVEAYPDCVFIVTSRPGASDKGMFRTLGFVDAEINELSDDQRSVFIDTWHSAFGNRVSTVTSAEMSELARDLKERLAGQPQIARLATNPLLCAGICALHERSGRTLPKNEWDLCAKLTEMLADQRDRVPGRQGAMQPAALGHLLDYPVRRGVLARLADAMVSQQLSALARDDALQHVAAALRGVREAAQVTADQVLEALALRSGVLRPASALDGQSSDALEFVHNTLRSWLASLHCLEENKPRELAARALVTQVTEVVVFAAAAPTHEAYANALIAEVVEKAGQQPDAAPRRALEVVALRCDAAAPRLDETLRARLEKLAAALFPPRSVDEAQSLAAMGDLAVARLRARPSAGPEAAACVRCLRLIATPAALAALEGYRDTEDADTLEELAQVFDPLTLPAVRAAVEQYKKWGSLRPSIKARVGSLEALSGRQVRHLSVSETAIRDLGPLAGLAELRSLDISSTPVESVAPIATLPKLTALWADGTKCRDFSPLFAIRDLQLLWLGGSEPFSLTGIEALQNLRLLRVVGPYAPDLTPIAGLGKLVDLGFHFSAGMDLTPVRQLHNLEKLLLGGCDNERINLLAALQNLRELDISGTVRDLAGLARMTALTRLKLDSTEVVSLEPILHLPNLKRLEARDSPLSESEVQRFQAAVPGRTVEWSPRAAAR